MGGSGVLLRRIERLQARLQRPVRSQGLFKLRLVLTALLLGFLKPGAKVLVLLAGEIQQDVQSLLIRGLPGQLGSVLARHQID